MIIYNVTFKITWHIHPDWLKWMQEEHIPEIMSTGCFVKQQLAQLLDTDDAEGPTYATQYYAETLELYEDFMINFATALRKKSTDKWGDQFIAFRTVMEVVN